MNELTVVKPLSASEIRERKNLIKQVMDSIMKRDVHYGVIPGTKKPTLYKAGSETILSTFHIAVDPLVEDLSTADEIRYRVKVRGVLPDGTLVGSGVGECSTSEEKYRWRAAVCDEEFEDTPESRRRIKYAAKYGQAATKTKQVRTVPADLANTVLKMAKKRAQIDMTLTATGASDIFDQDIEDLPEEYVAEHVAAPPKGKPPVQPPQRKSETKTATQGQVSMIRAKLERARLPEDSFCQHLQIDCLDSLPFTQVNEALQAIQKEAARG